MFKSRVDFSPHASRLHKAGVLTKTLSEREDTEVMFIMALGETQKS